MKYFSLFFTVCVTIFTIVSCGANGGSGNDKDASNKAQQVVDSSKMPIVELPIDKAPQIKFDTIKLGRILEGESVESNFIIKNSSEKTVAIGSIVTGCGCVTAGFDKNPIKTDQSRIVTIKYNSKGQFGTQMKVVEIVTTDYNIARIYVTCTVIDD